MFCKTKIYIGVIFPEPKRFKMIHPKIQLLFNLKESEHSIQYVFLSTVPFGILFQRCGTNLSMPTFIQVLFKPSKRFNTYLYITLNVINMIMINPMKPK